MGDRPPPFPENDSIVDDVNSERRSSGEPVRFLFIGMDIGRGLNLRGQWKEIKNILRSSKKAGPFRVKAVFDATAEGLPDILNGYLPSIVHFSGNQSGGRIVLPSIGGGVTTIPATALAGLLQSLDGAVTVAIIDTCDSLPCAQRIVSGVNFALGVKGKPYDHDATAFYCNFYKAISSGLSIGAAVGQARAAHKFKGVKSTETPQLCVRKGIDPSKLTFRREAGRVPAKEKRNAPST